MAKKKIEGHFVAIWDVSKRCDLAVHTYITYLGNLHNIAISGAFLKMVYQNCKIYMRLNINLPKLFKLLYLLYLSKQKTIINNNNNNKKQGILPPPPPPLTVP